MNDTQGDSMSDKQGGSMNEPQAPIMLHCEYADLQCPACRYAGRDDDGFFVTCVVMLNGAGQPVYGSVTPHGLMIECSQCGHRWPDQGFSVDELDAWHRRTGKDRTCNECGQLWRGSPWFQPAEEPARGD